MLTKILRKDARFQAIPILAMTAHALSVDRDKSLAAGMNDHITKPIDPKKLYQALETWLPKKADTTQLGGVVRVSQNKDDAGVIPELPGLDVKAALQRFDGRTNRLMRLLLRFLEDHNAHERTLRNAFKAKDLGTISSLTHSLKSTAGYLCAEDLSQSAATIEHHIRTQQTEYLHDNLEELYRRLSVVLNGLAVLQKQQHELKDKPTEVQQDTHEHDQAALALLQDLKPLILEGAFESISILDELEKLLSQSPLCEKIIHIRNAFEELEIGIAEAEIIQLIHDLKKGNT